MQMEQIVSIPARERGRRAAVSLDPYRKVGPYARARKILPVMEELLDVYRPKVFISCGRTWASGICRWETSTQNKNTMDEPLENRLRFLRKASTEQMPHSEAGLFDHLLGTWRLLVEWEARPALCDAGLFHSIYSTERYELEAIPLSMRDEVRQLIGDEAESLVWLFCVMRRKTFDQNIHKDRNLSVQHRLTGEWIPLTKGQFQDLITMTFANSLEAFPRCSWKVRRGIRRYFRRFRNHAIRPAQIAFDRIEVQWWEFWK